MKGLLFGLLCACALQATVSAHVLDQYLQVAQIGMSPDGVRVQLRLVPGVQVAERISALIDTDGDGRISPSEEQAYARRVLQDIALQVDGRRVQLALTGVQFPSQREMNGGIGAIRLDLAAGTVWGGAGEHQLMFRNDHLPELGAYMANALVPATDAIAITGEQRDELQHGLQVDFQVRPINARTWPHWTGVLPPGLCLAIAAFLYWKGQPRKSSAAVESGTVPHSS